MSAPKNIIIKQVKKKEDEGHHGGSWKVAYADFVTGMMAFFLLMWLISMTGAEQKAQISSYFTHFSIFDGGAPPAGRNTAVTGTSGGKQAAPAEETPPAVDTLDPETVTPEKLQEKLRTEIQAKLKGLEDQVLIEVFSGGVRIQLVDKDGRSLFPLGGSELTPIGRKMLEIVAGSVKDIPNKIAIEGHTDALSYSSNRYTNWELSTERASAARKELEAAGLDPDRLTMVAGYAATRPLIKDNPNDPRNRRIGIIVRFPGAAGKAADNGESLEKNGSGDVDGNGENGKSAR